MNAPNAAPSMSFGSPPIPFKFAKAAHLGRSMNSNHLGISPSGSMAAQEAVMALITAWHMRSLNEYGQNSLDGNLIAVRARYLCVADCHAPS